MKCFIGDALFNDFYTDGDGSVINLNNVALTILCSVFQENTATRNGGSIYALNANFNISKTTFFHCQSSANRDNIAGNAIYQSKHTTNIQHTSLLLCAKSSEIRSDSSIKLFQSTAKCNHINFTSNNGNAGASGISLDRPNTDSSVSFINVYDVLDHYSIEAFVNHYQVTLSNFVKFNPEFNTNIVWMSANNLLTFTECCFFETNGVSLSYNNLQVIIENCLIGEESPSFTFASSITLQQIVLDLKCRPVLRTCQIKIMKSIYMKLSIFIMIMK